ncbi:MAG: RnfABCDGE type electron transport complex subunit D [bacterium]
MPSESPLFTVGPPPHWRSKVSVSKTNYAFILALLPAALIGALLQSVGAGGLPALAEAPGVKLDIVAELIKELGVEGWLLGLGGSIGLLALGAGAGLVVEYIVQVIFRQPYYATNGHGVLMGMLLAMVMPPTVPWWVLFLGVAIAIVLGKQIYGGLGGYPFHPMIVGWLIILLSWGYHIRLVEHNSIAAIHPAVVFFILIGGVALVALGHVRWEVPFGIIIGVLASWALFNHLYPDNPKAGNLVEIFTTTHVILAAFFIATDQTSSPANKTGIWVYAIGIGVLYMLIRVYGKWQDPVPFAIILMNILAPLADRIRPKPREVVIQNG